MLVVRGGNGNGQLPDSLINSYFQAGVCLNVIYVRGWGDGTNTDRYKQIARETGGQYRETYEFSQGRPPLFSSSVNTEITNLIQDINGFRRTRFGTIAPTHTNVSTMRVEPGAESAYFAIQSASDLTGISTSLVSPSGSRFSMPVSLTPVLRTSARVQLAQTADYSVDSSSTKAMMILAPEAGDWQLSITPTTGATLPEDAEVVAYVKHDGVSISVNPRLEEVTLAEPIKLEAFASYEGERIITNLVTISETITRPDGSSVVVALYDDGDEAHNDELAGDGIYSALFDDYVGAGIYTIEASVNVPGGVTVPGESFDNTIAPTVRSVPAFSAAGKATVSVKP